MSHIRCRMSRVLFKIVLLLIFAPGLGFAQTPPYQLSQSQIQQAANLVHDWNWKIIDIMMEDGFPPTNQSRIITYCNLAAYLAAYHGFPGYQSPENQLRDLQNVPKPPADAVIDWRLSMVEAFNVMTSSALLYRSHMKDALYKSHIQSFQNEKMPEEVFKASVAFGQSVAKSIISWFANDGHKRNQGRPRYRFPQGPGNWMPTPPDFADPLDPYFRFMRPLVTDSAGQFKARPPVPFSTEPRSPFYEQTISVYIKGKSLSAEDSLIARFWDDTPVKTTNSGHFNFNTRQISPAGHWNNITTQILRLTGKNMIESLEAQLAVGVAMYEAMLSCWNEKYTSNLIRPVTYIHRHIDSTWHPLLQTPPFPEHTSGHSTLSAAAAEILTRDFGIVKFTDSTETLFGLPTRTFNSFHEAAQEASISRFYGGIHYIHALNEGNRVGTEIGAYVWERLALRKRD